jgi:hypothetical protein
MTSSLPKQVQDQLAAAEATLAGINAPQEAPEQVAQVSTEVTPEPVKQAEPQPQVQAAKPVEDFEHKYRVLQGKYSHEVPRLHEQVKTLEANLSAAVERLNKAAAEKERAPEPNVAAEPKDVEEFGADLVNMVVRVSQATLARAAQAIDSKVAELDSKIAALSDQLKGTSQTVVASAEQTFFDRLTRVVPEWERINADQGFLNWLAEEDPVYGVPRQNALQLAQQQLNVERVAAVFNAYIGPRKEQAPKTDPLDKHVSPKSAASVAPAATGKPVITQAQVTQFYTELRQGKYRGNEAEAARLEQMINSALAEGRVR